MQTASGILDNLIFGTLNSVANRWNTIAIAGVGLIGGSIGSGVLERGLAKNVIGIGRNGAKLEGAKRLGVITDFTTNLEKGVSEAEIVVICTPVDSIADFVLRTAGSCPSQAIITDAGSTKGRIVSEVETQWRLNSQLFIGSHPLAGSEKSGAEFADSNLLAGRTVIVTPTDKSDAGRLGQLELFWTALGAKVVLMSPQAHDQTLAMTSHLPHLLASVLAASTPDSALPFASTGWMDTTRIAAGDVELWVQILSQNRAETLRSLRSFQAVLDQFKQALELDQSDQLAKLLAIGKTQRDALGS